MLDTKYIDNKFFHVFTVDFIVDDFLEWYIININSDPEFIMKKTVFDEPKQNMIEDILKNVWLQIVKNMPVKKFKELKLKESHRLMYENITSGKKNAGIPMRFQKQLNKNLQSTNHLRLINTDIKEDGNLSPGMTMQPSNAHK